MRIINGDCLEELTHLKDNSVDMCLTDPPYGTTACKWDRVIPFDPMWRELKRVIKDNGAIALFGSEPFSSAMRMSNIKNFKYDWVWIKVKGVGFLNAKKQPLRKTENISVFYRSQANYSPQGLIVSTKKNKCYTKGMETFGKTNQNHSQDVTYKNYPNNILNFKNDSKRLHPTQKPVALLEYLIKTYTLEGETVLDFTMGSGSTGVAAKNLNRKFIGIEINKEYCDIAKRRISNGPLFSV